MHNTYLLTLVMMLTAVSASAQFYTITKETEISGTEKSIKIETPEMKEDTIEFADSTASSLQKFENKENSGQTVLDSCRVKQWRWCSLVR